eukprot:1516489-Pyramimonas_sp.AAC.1
MQVINFRTHRPSGLVRVYTTFLIGLQDSALTGLQDFSQAYRVGYSHGWGSGGGQEGTRGGSIYTRPTTDGEPC